jgi:protein TonB
MSLAAHAVMVALLVIGISVQPTPVDTKGPPVKLNAVYIPLAGELGGGGGNRSPASADRLEVPRHERPKAVPIEPQPVEPEPPHDPVPTIDVAIETDAATMLRAMSSGLPSIGPGGLGRPGRGAGDGDGPGVGPGRGGQQGGGDRADGGIEPPTLIRSVDPAYTPEALTRKLSGRVELEAVVLPNGTIGQIRIVRSLDPGLDRQAILAARQWLFRPSTQQGKPVEVIVKLILEFHIR